MKKLRRFLAINRVKELELQICKPSSFLNEVADDFDAQYRSFEMVRKGKAREVFEASDRLKAIHKSINRELLDKILFPEEFHGGIIGGSILKNAMVHSGKRYVANFDIKNFFPSVDFHVVYEAFRSQKCAPDVARLLTRLTTARTELPQGFGTSPKISIFVLCGINERLRHLLEPLGLSHTFWIDDLTISGHRPIKKMEKEIYKIFKQSGFTLNPDKTHVSHRTARQTCTGLVVNGRPNALKSFRRKIRQELHACAKYGVRNYLNKRGIQVDKEKYLESLRGRIGFLLSIDPSKNSHLLDFERLVKAEGCQSKEERKKDN